MRGMMKKLRGAVIGSAMLLAGCVAMDVGPINTQTHLPQPPSPEFFPDSGDDGSTVVGLAFSGGGMRASAFSYGVLRALDDIVVDEKPVRRTLVDDIRMISGVSGGAITAAYFGYRGRDNYRDFDERFLRQNAESSMRTSISPANLSRAWNGGVNDLDTFARWLDENLFNGATFSSFRWANAPIVWLSASDIYNRTPFLFTYDTFAALCSDLSALKLSDAVAASAAVPVVFTPVIITAQNPQCAYQHPAWLKTALRRDNVSLRLQAYAQALDSYQNKDSLNYVRLMDGGLTDNLGITGFVLERAASSTPHGPLSAEEAVRLRNFVLIVADAGRGQTAKWGSTMHGPGMMPLMGAVVDTGMASSVRDELDALNFAVQEWSGKLVQYRCGLPLATVRKIRGTTAGWDCRDVHMVVERLAFNDLNPALEAKLNNVPTRLALPAEQIDELVEAGRETVATSRIIQEVVSGIWPKGAPRPDVQLTND
ncbi:patatin-like phospholipase family protein [Corticibacterium sp. UT-5YL-CI-8]|nr:patatin-like phospholipase family protein [Tianweitania sp. UT-5YL-CI-8]